ncbi:hypothetical protein DY000_02023217 [Brassica cretica]|uniref:Uncharacterized protein n=1 Tax=Brassica cretica TaxID=69181 RepID=A0ABQ7EJ68_BRACR|nr:hypothetical protein DY000_02023217 [Brassica cretica]
MGKRKKQKPKSPSSASSRGSSKSSANSTQTSGVKKHLTPVSAPSTPIENASAVIAIDSAIPSLSDPNLKTRSTVPDPIDATVAAPETALAVPSKTLVITGGETPVLTSNNLYAPTANAVNPEDATVAQPTEKQVAPFATPATTGGEIPVLASANPYARAALAVNPENANKASSSKLVVPEQLI